MNYKKILFVITGLTSGGAERVMCTLSNNLCLENDVTIATALSTECFYPLNDKVKRVQLGSVVNKKNKLTKLTTRFISGVNCFLRLKRLIKKNKYDVVVSFLPDTNMLSILVKMFSFNKFKLIVSERADPWQYSKFKKWFERNLYYKADYIVCQAQNVVNFFKPKHQSKCVVIPNPICKEAIPSCYTGERPNKIVAVGRLVHVKGFDLLINAFSKLPNNFKDYTLEIYGEGVLKDTLQKQIDGLSLNQKVFLMGAKKGVMNYVKDAKLFVMSSRHEGFPNALVEAMATGLPVISTDFKTGVAKEIVKSENGIVVPVEDEQALLNAMVELLSDEDRLKQLSKNNLKIIDELNEDKIVKIWENLL